MKKVHIALLMMVKNEHKRLRVTLDSVAGHVDSLVIYDTGSEDDTVNILEEFSKQHNIPLRLKEGVFSNFSESRNVSLDFADTFEDIDYLLLLDCNDELRGGEILRKNCEIYNDKPNTGFLICQEWWSGHYDKYYNIRLIKARKGWRYRGKVHEWMKNTRYESDEEARKDGDFVLRVEENLVLFQDRTQDDDKSGKRFVRDKILLLEDHKDDPSEPRTVFYLAQTCGCIGDTEDAFYYYKLRTTLEGFWEERFHSFYRCGELSEGFRHPWEESMKWYVKAFEHTQRVEPLIKITEHYKDRNWILCYTFANLACNLAYPTQCILFVDKHAYDYTRWHLLGIAGWYSGFFAEGKAGCLKAIECGLNLEVDKNNLKHYEERERKLEEEKNPNQAITSEKAAITSEKAANTSEKAVTKSEFIQSICKQISKDCPGLSSKQIHNRANRMWKNRKNIA